VEQVAHGDTAPLLHPLYRVERVARWRNVAPVPENQEKRADEIETEWRTERWRIARPQKPLKSGDHPAHITPLAPMPYGVETVTFTSRFPRCPARRHVIGAF
jgi:hypothetical protein